MDRPVSSYDSFDVPVPGGDLRVGRWTASDPAAPVVVAAHGVTANHRTWALVAEQADFTLVAPDLRGRGRSGALEGSAGMARHADDLLAVLDHLAVDTAVVRRPSPDVTRTGPPRSSCSTGAYRCAHRLLGPRRRRRSPPPSAQPHSG
jgi:alpha-beta hydrolase superfamily lysophospholipase